MAKRLMKHNSVNKAFRLGVKYFEEMVVGHGITGEAVLLEAGKEFFGKAFGGVLASNELPPRRPGKSDRYYIMNNMPRGSAGEHWLALVMASDGRVVVWDSFGRPIETLMPTLWKKYRRWVVEPERDKEQKKTQEDCGARSLAFTAVYDILGREYAMML